MFEYWLLFVHRSGGYCSCPRSMPSSRTSRAHDMDPTMEQIVASMGIDVSESFLAVPDRRSIVSNLKPVTSESAKLHMSFAKVGVLETAAHAGTSEKWNVATILCGDGEFQLSSKLFFGSSSLDGSVSGFWPLVRDSLNTTWAPKMHHHCFDWLYRAVTRAVHLQRRHGKSPARHFVNIERYSSNTAPVLIRNTLKCWLQGNPGLCLFQLYEEIRNQHSFEKPKILKRILLSMPRGVR